MSRPQFHHDKVNDQNEMDAQVRRCLEIIGMSTEEEQARMGDRDRSFYMDMCSKANLGRMYVTERQLNWLKDIKDRVIR